MEITIDTNDIACTLRTSTDGCPELNWNKILKNFNEFDDDFIGFSDLIRSQYDIEFDDYSPLYYELLDCNTLEDVLAFVCKYNSDIKIK